MFTFLIVLIAIIGLLLMLLVLLQSGKGGGLAGIASGGATTQILGARQAPDVLEKGTWGLAVAFVVLCILSNLFLPGQETQAPVVQPGSVPAEQQPLTLPESGQQAPAQGVPVQPAPGGGENGSGSDGSP